MTIYLVRHAHAGTRSSWGGADRDRPLSSRGLQESMGLLERYRDVPISRVLSSPAMRCQQTVAPIADDRGLVVQSCAPLDEGTPADEPMALIRSLAGADVVMCTHGDVLPTIVAALLASGVAVSDQHGNAKAGTFEITTRGSDLVSARYVPPPEF